MHGMTYTIEKDVLIISIPIGKKMITDAEPSKSGKTNIVASTSGAVTIPCGHCKELKLGLNLMAKK